MVWCGVLCAAQGCWQPPEDFQAAGRFTQIAAAVRAAKAAGSHRGPLEGRLVYIQCAANPAAAKALAAGAGADGGSSGGGGAGGPAAFTSHLAAAAHRQSLQRLVRALGGRVCGPRAAEVCVLCAGAGVPRELPAAAAAVSEEWLLSVAATHTGVEEKLKLHEVPRKQPQQQQQ